MIRNTINGKVYIGKSIHIEQRWKQHRQHFNNNYHDNKHFQDAWNKYGESAFEFLTLEVCDEKDLDRKETEYIKKFESDNPQKGYNLTLGGEGRRLTEELKQRLRKSKPPRTKEHSMKLGLAHIGCTPWNKGTKMSEEARRKQSAAKLGKPAFNRKAVLCKETNVVYESSYDASQSTGVQATNIRKCCRGERPVAGGFHWAYVNTPIPR